MEVSPHRKFRPFLPLAALLTLRRDRTPRSQGSYCHPMDLPYALGRSHVPRSRVAMVVGPQGKVGTGRSIGRASWSKIDGQRSGSRCHDASSHRGRVSREPQLDRALQGNRPASNSYRLLYLRRTKLGWKPYRQPSRLFLPA